MISSFLKQRQPSKASDQQGIIMILVLITGLIVTFALMSLSDLAIRQFASSSNDVFSANVEQTAEAGIEQTLDQLNSNSSFTGYSTPQVLLNNAPQGYATYTSTVSNGPNGHEKFITATANIYVNSKSTKILHSRKIKVTVVGTSSTGYSLYGGPGGLILSGSASISNPSIYVEGGITMSGAAILGNPLAPGTLDVANNRCPTGKNPGATFPQVCSNGSQPISMSGVSAIFATVCATGQTSHSGISNLKAGCTAPIGQMPTYDRMAQINAVTTTATGTSATSGCTLLTPKTWAANVKFTGNVSLSSTCKVTVSGNVYITGNLSLSGSSLMTVANSLGTTRPVIIVDGTVSISGASILTENSSGTGIEFISFKSSNSCTTSTTAYCSSISGNDLYNSMGTQTVTISGASVLPGMIFDAYWGLIKVSGASLVGTVAGQTVDLSGAGNLTFGTTLSSGQYTWTIRAYQQLYN
ncbi:MAG TPA: hypothetical protein VG604_04500 [Candidatus Saccharimonadales bacterium]|nr:hypothetical protein [Candidatus Saccharimonadales bacterium]